MLHRILAKLLDAILAHPGRALGFGIGATALALALGSQVEFRTSRADLAPPDDPDQRRFDAFLEETGGALDLIACVEAAPGVDKPPDDLRRFADLLAADFAKDPHVEHVFHRASLDWYLERGFHLAPPAWIHQAVAAARKEQASFDLMPALTGLDGVNNALAARLEKGLTEGGSVPDAAEAAQGIEQLTEFLRLERKFLADPAGSVAALEAEPPLVSLAGDRPEIAARGYLTTRDRKTLFILISPKSRDDSLPVLEELVGSIRARAAAISRSSPGFHVAFTGEPATTVEEMEVVQRDTWFTSCVAAAGVTLLTLFVFRWKSHALLVLASLAIGVAWAFGAVKLELGYLNLITSSFISTLVGLGIAYGIHPVSEYELQGAHSLDPAAAIRKAYLATGAAVTVGAVTTSAAFLSILLMKFKGFAELGLVAGIGVLLCLLASLLALPAILILYGRWRHARDREGRGQDALAAVDRLWVERGAGLVCRHPWTVTILSLALTAVLGWEALGVGFDPNILALLPRNSESVRYQNRMILESNLSPNFTVVVAPDIAALRDIRDRAAADPAIERVDSALELMPDDPAASRAAVSDLRAFLDGVKLPSKVAAANRPALEASFRRLEEAFAQAGEAAFGAGLGALAGPLEGARAEAESARAQVAAAPPGSEAAWEDGERRLLAWAGRALEDLRRASRTEPPAPKDLPAEARDHFVKQDGRFFAYVYPKGNVFDPPFLDRFVAGSRRLSADALGFPIVFQSMTGRITSGFHRAATAAGILVLVLLYAKFGNVKDTFLALIPKLMGVVWMMGGMRLLDLSYNFANLVAIPLILGVGIDTGVHIIHRMRAEGEGGMTLVLRHTGRAILIAGLTTMLGFGSLALASHRGLASLGTVLLLGLGSCIVTATIVLPNMLVAFRLVKR
ncbi:MAG: MMPL family transporter [Acidobacteria bacterium]|nr:MMPL family transporter [Acidobacteriota bacterium]